MTIIDTETLQSDINTIVTLDRFESMTVTVINDYDCYSSYNNDDYEFPLAILTPLVLRLLQKHYKIVTDSEVLLVTLESIRYWNS
jgi:hypothetical protein